MRWNLILAGLLAVGLGGCAPPDTALETAMLLTPAATGAKQTAATMPPGPAVQAPPGLPVGAQSASRYDRVLNLDTVHLTNNAYGPGRSSDAYGRLVLHDPGLVITRVPGRTHTYEDQYGRPVRCYAAGAETICK